MAGARGPQRACVRPVSPVCSVWVPSAPVRVLPRPSAHAVFIHVELLKDTRVFKAFSIHVVALPSRKVFPFFIYTRSACFPVSLVRKKVIMHI